MNRSLSPITATTRLTAQVVEGGLDTDRIGLLLLAHQAQDLGISPILIDVMVDEHAPQPARLRAYGRVSSRYCALVNRPVVREQLLVSA
jgi:hypothetical protein